MISPYPWHALRRVTRESLSAEREARRRIARVIDVQRLAGAAAEVLQMDVGFRVRDGAATTGPAEWAELAFESPSEEALFSLRPDPALVNAVLSRVLDRPAQVLLAARPLDPALMGALSAVVIEIARRTHASSPLRAGLRAAAEGPTVALAVTVTLDGRPYELFVAANGAARPTQAGAEGALRSLGELPICVPVVIGVATLERAELASLEPGDAFVPGPGMTLDATRRGAAVLAGSLSAEGVAVTLTEQGGLVLRGETVALALDGGHMAEGEEATGDAVNRTALEAPLVVRVELGSVTLLAREWAELKPGDVIETGRRIAEPVILRVAGQEVARGELVNIDGELGVRIQSLAGGVSS